MNGRFRSSFFFARGRLLQTPFGEHPRNSALGCSLAAALLPLDTWYFPPSWPIGGVGDTKAFAKATSNWKTLDNNAHLSHLG